jgi:hypothetical protein
MATTDIGNAPINDSMKRQLKTLRQSPVFYNLLSLIPSECTWTLPVEELERYVKETASEFLGKDEVRYVTIDAGPKIEPRTYVWIKADSRHLVDRSKSNNTNMAITPKVERFSEDLKKFCDQFAPAYREDGSFINRKKRIQIARPSDRTDSSLRAVKVDLTRILLRIFDTDNRAFLDTYGSDTPARRVGLRFKVHWDKKGDRRALSAVSITKYFEGAGRRERPRVANSSFSDRERGDRDRRDDED